MPMSMTRNSKRPWSNPFKKKSKDLKEERLDSTRKLEESQKSCEDEMNLSPTSVASDFSPEPVSRKAHLSILDIAQAAPVLDSKVSETGSNESLDEKAKYGHNDESKYGYEDASPDNKYGYEEAAPDKKDATLDYKYGYEDAAPDNKYGYEDATLDHKYGYEDAAPDNKYGYEDTCPNYRTKNRYARRSSTTPANRRATPRRSSMKQSGAPRRASIQFGGEVEVRLPGSAEKVKRRTSITFKESVKVKQVAPIALLAEDSDELWFQDDDYRRMRNKSYDLVDKVERGAVPRGKKYCIRGLERLMTENSGKVSQRKNEVWDSVLDEQDVQRETGAFDDEYMGSVSQWSTKACQNEAVERAEQDAADIKDYLRSTRRYCRRLSM